MIVQWLVTKDGEIVKRFDTKEEAFKYLHDVQPNSVLHATKHDGWDVEELRVNY